MCLPILRTLCIKDILQEASLIANDVADRQLKDLEKQAFGVMTTPGANDVIKYMK